MSGWVATRVRKFVAEQKCQQDDEAGPFVTVVNAKDQPASTINPVQEDSQPPELTEAEFDEPEKGEQGQDQQPPAEKEKDKTEEPKPSEEDHPPSEVNEKVEILKDPEVETENVSEPPPKEENDEDW